MFLKIAGFCFFFIQENKEENDKIKRNQLNADVTTKY